MIPHGPSCLEGPVSKSRDMWRNDATEFCAVEPQLPLETEGIRTDLVLRVRREIAAGTYETEDKLELALAKLFQAIDVE